MKKFYLAFIILIFFSCNKNQKKIAISKFSLEEIPESFMGCSCLYSNSKESYDSGKYIYFDDFGDTAIISIHGNLVFLKFSKDKYSNGDYTVYIQNEVQVDEGYETTTYNAELVTLDNEGNKSIYKVYGVCGC